MATANEDPFSGPGLFAYQGSGFTDGNFGNPYFPLFGPPSNEVMGGPGRDRLTTHSDLPAAYADGRNVEWLSTAVDGLTAVDLNWVQTLAFPMEFTKSKQWAWNKLQFTQPYIDKVGHEGVPRLIKSGMRTYHAEAQKYAIGLQFENYFLETPQGILHFALSLQQLRLMIQRTNSDEGIYALMTAHRKEELWDAANNYVNRSPVEKMLQEIHRFGFVQKNGNTGMLLMDAQIREHASLQQWAPTMLVVPPGLRPWLTYVPPSDTQYLFVGPNGRRAMLAGPEAMTKFQGLNVYETPMYAQNDSSEHANLTDRNFVIGEHYVLRDHLLGTLQAARTKEDRTIQVLDETGKCWAYWGVEDGLDEGLRHDADGELRKEHYDLARQGKPDILNYRNTSGDGYRVAHFMGQIEPENLKPRVVTAVEDSWMAHISPEDRVAIVRLAQLQRELAEITAALETPTAGAGTFANQKATREWLAGRAEARMGGCGNYVALEALAEYKGNTENGKICKAGIAAMQRVYEDACASFGADALFLDPARCPENLAKFTANTGVCNYFESAISRTNLPIFWTESGTYAGFGFDAASPSDRAHWIEARATEARAAAAATPITPGAAMSLGEQFDLLLEFYMARHNACLAKASPIPVDDTPAAQIAAERDSAKLLYAPVAFVTLLAPMDAVQQSATLTAIRSTLAAKAGERAFQLENADTWSGVPESKALSALDLAINDYMPALRGALAGKNHNATIEPAALQAKRLLNAAVASVAAGDFVATPLTINPGVTNVTDPYRPGDPATGFTTPAKEVKLANLANYKKAPRVPQLVTGVRPRPVQSIRSGTGAAATAAPTYLNPTTASGLADGAEIDHPQHFTNSRGFMLLHERLMATPDVLRRLALGAFIYTRTTAQAFRAMMNGRIAIPFGYLVVRPWMSYRMSAVIWLKGGPSMGRTFFGNSNFMFSQNAQTKMIFGHLSYYSRVVVIEPKYVVVVEGAFYRRYLGGDSAAPIPWKEALSLANTNFIRPVHREMTSALFFLVPADYAPPNIMDISGRFGNMHDAGANELGDKMHYPSANYYNLLLKFGKLSKSRLGYSAFGGLSRRVNSITCYGHQAMFNPQSGRWDHSVHLNTGHHGPDVDIGVCEVRDGRYAPMPSDGLHVVSRQVRSY